MAFSAWSGSCGAGVGLAAPRRLARAPWLVAVRPRPASGFSGDGETNSELRQQNGPRSSGSARDRAETPPGRVRARGRTGNPSDRNRYRPLRPAPASAVRLRVSSGASAQASAPARKPVPVSAPVRWPVPVRAAGPPAQRLQAVRHGLGEKITAVPSSGGGNGRVSIRSKLASSAVSCSAALSGKAAGSGGTAALDCRRRLDRCAQRLAPSRSASPPSGPGRRQARPAVRAHRSPAAEPRRPGRAAARRRRRSAPGGFRGFSCSAAAATSTVGGSAATALPPAISIIASTRCSNSSSMVAAVSESATVLARAMACAMSASAARSRSSVACSSRTTVPIRLSAARISARVGAEARGLA